MKGIDKLIKALDCPSDYDLKDVCDNKCNDCWKRALELEYEDDKLTLEEELKQASQPLIDFLMKHYDEMTQINVNINYVDVIERKIGLDLSDCNACSDDEW